MFTHAPSSVTSAVRCFFATMEQANGANDQLMSIGCLQQRRCRENASARRRAATLGAQENVFFLFFGPNIQPRHSLHVHVSVTHLLSASGVCDPRLYQGQLHSARLENARWVARVGEHEVDVVSAAADVQGHQPALGGG